MDELEALERAAGLDPDSQDYRLRESLAKADNELLENLVRMRKAKGLTQQVVADRMKRDKSAVSNFERLGTDPHLSTIRRYAAAIGASVEHRVQDFECIDSSDYKSVVEERFKVFRSWTADIAKGLGARAEVADNVVYLDAYRGPLTDEFEIASETRAYCNG
ncbi:helix-turn-helix domain-containing protein [Mycolicibacterium nivoides]|uniref:Helix-turn-helix domain-containing protein n=1 Tax=Mycolicibacterium nivoides TaxID=2487344 RepID=A0ABW9LAE7_9MYCO